MKYSKIKEDIVKCFDDYKKMSGVAFIVNDKPRKYRNVNTKFKKYDGEILFFPRKLIDNIAMKMNKVLVKIPDDKSKKR